MTIKQDLPDPFVFIPKKGAPALLFVLLHGESVDPRQMFPLADALNQAFPRAMVVLPYAFENISDSSSAPDAGRKGRAVYTWINPLDLQYITYVERVSHAFPLLIKSNI